MNWARMNRLSRRWLPPARIPGPTRASTFGPEARARCGSAARRDLCGGPRATGVLPRQLRLSHRPAGGEAPPLLHRGPIEIDYESPCDAVVVALEPVMKGWTAAVD